MISTYSPVVQSLAVVSGDVHQIKIKIIPSKYRHTISSGTPPQFANTVGRHTIGAGFSGMAYSSSLPTLPARRKDIVIHSDDRTYIDDDSSDERILCLPLQDVKAH